MNVWHDFSLTAKKYSSNTALEYGNLTYSYQQLDLAVKRLQCLVKNKLKTTQENLDKPQRVAVYVNKSPLWVASLLLTQKAGQIFIPLDPNWPAKRTQLILRQTQPQLVISNDVDLSDTIDPELVLTVDDTIFDAYLDSEEGVADSQKAGYLYFTSGSTGEPKGILGRTDALAHFIRWQSNFLKMTDKDKGVMLTSVGFDPVLRDTLLPLCNGASLVIPTDPDILLDPERTLQFLCEAGVTLVHQVPSIVELWLQQPKSNIQDALANVRALMLAGEKLRPELANTIYAMAPESLVLYNFYGPTETTLARFCFKVPNLLLSELQAMGATVPVGKPIADSRFVLKHDDSASKRGEVIIETQYSSAGYWDAQSLQARAFPLSQDNYSVYVTGDQGTINHNGDLVILGRLDKQIKITGQRIELAEIELVCERLSGIDKAIVTYHQSEQGNHYICAHIVSAMTLDIETLNEHFTEHLPSYMIPSKIFVYSRFTLLPNGKVDRMKLLKFAQGERLDTDVTLLKSTKWAKDDQVWPLDNPVAHVIKDIWLSTFEQNTFSASRSAFALGGSSLQLVSVLAQLKTRTGVAVPYFEFATAPVAAHLLSLYEKYEHIDAHKTQNKQQDKSVLTLAQQGLVFTQQLNPQQPLYNMPYSIVFEGAVDIQKLSIALKEVSERYQLDRVIDLNTHRWQFGSAPKLETLYVDDIVDAEQALQIWAREIFDLCQGPLLKVMVVKTPSKWQLAVCAHHVIMDADKFLLTVENLLASYHKTSWVDLPKWSSDTASLANYSEAQGYWQQRLQHVSTELDLTGIKHNCSTFSGGLLEFSLSPELTQSLLSLAQQQQISINSLLFASFQTFLFKYSSQSQIVTGLPFKLASELQDNFNINLLPIVTEFDSQQSFEELLSRVAQDIQAAIHHGCYPFSSMVSDLNLQGTLGYHPVFQSLFAYHESTIPVNYTQGGLKRIDSQIARYSLSADMWLHGDQFQGLFEYGHVAFDTYQAKQLTTHFIQLLAHITAQPKALLSQLSVLDATERQQIHTMARTTGKMPDIHTIDGMIGAQARLTPTLAAVTYQSCTISYRELEILAQQWSKQLYHLGIRPKTRVGLSISRSIELVVGFYAILKLGAVYVPLDPDYPAQRREFIIEDTQMDFLLCETLVVSQYQSMDVKCLVFDSAGHIFQYDAKPSLVNIQAHSDSDFVAEHSGQDVAYVIYTSGSTGKPKGVEVPHIGVCNLAYGEIEFLDMKPGSRVLQFASFSFDTSIWEIVMTLCSGGVLVMADKLTILPGPDLANTLLEQRISHVTLPASSLAALPYQAYPDLSVIITAGEACAVDLLQLWGKGRRFVNSYGPTEASVSASNAELQWDGGVVHIGHPLPNVQTWILDNEQQLRPIGLPGELYVGGIGVAKGYLNRPELTAEKFLADPFSSVSNAKMYRTGDLVRLNQYGQLEFLGRIDEQVKIRGYRIEPSEIETVLRQSDQVIDAKVVVKSVQSIPMLVAYVSVGQRHFHESRLREYLAERLPNYMQVDRFVAIKDFPRLPNNKINIKALPEPKLKRSSSRQLESDDSVVSKIGKIWQEFLVVERLTQNDNFFNVGGNSLLAVSMMRKLSKSFSIDLGVSELFRYPTVRELALCIKQQQAKQPAQVEKTPVAVMENTWYPMTSSQQRLYYLQQLDEKSTSYNLVFCDIFKGQLQIKELYQALYYTLYRHGGLRCEFRSSGEGLEQRVVDDPTQLKQINYSEGAEHFAEYCEEFSHKLRCQVWDLNTGIPFNITLITDNELNHAVIVGCHHIMVDQEAIVRFRGDWHNKYLQLCEISFDNTSAFTEGGVDYQIVHHALWQQKNRSSTAWKNSIDFWQSQLSDSQTQLNLPISKKSDLVAKVSTTSQYVGESIQSWIQARSKALQCSEFNCWFGVFYAFLYRYCGAQKDLTLLLPVLGLSTQEDYIGLRLNTLALRQQVDGRHTIDQLITQTRKRFLDATRHGQIPFDEVVDSLGWGGDKTPEVMFVYKETPVTQDLAGVPCHTTFFDSQQAKFPLTLFVESSEHQSQGVNCKWEYDSSRLSETNMRRIQHAWHVFLTHLSQSNGHQMMLADIAIDNEIYQSPTFTIKQPLSNHWLREKLQEAAHNHTNHMALIQGELQLTYLQAHQQSNQIANWLQEQVSNNNRQPRCLILQQHSPLLVVSIIAAVKAGWCYIPIDPNYPLARVNHIIEDASPDIILTDAQSATEFELDGQIPWVDVGHRSVPWSCFSDKVHKIANEASAAYIIYTSGSTGKPKGVEVGLSSLAHYLEFAQTTYLPDHLEGGMILHSSVGFDATVTSLFLPWLTGRPLYIVEPSQPLESLCELFAARHYSAVKIAPAHLDVLRQHVPEAQLGNATHLIIGGDALHHGALDYWRHTNVCVFNEYGPTEATVGCCVYQFKPKDAPTAEGVPIGHAIKGTELLVLDADLNIVPKGVIGELYIAGFSLANGYINLPKETAQKYRQHPFDPARTIYQSGDLVKYNQDDNLVYLSRKDNQVKLAGHRIELPEIEACALEIDAISEAIALVNRNKQGNEVLALYFVCSESVTEQKIRTKLNERLPHYMVPAQLCELSEMPLTHNGKVDRNALKSIEINTISSTDDDSNDPTIKILREIWQDVLRQEDISINDNFFSLGGDSIVSLQIIFKAREHGLKITPKMMLTHQSIAQLATVVSHEIQQQFVQHEGDFTPTPIMQWALHHNATNIHHVNQSRILILPENFDKALLCESLLRVINHHGMLRLKMLQKDQQWYAHIAPPFGQVFINECHTIKEEDFNCWLKEHQSSLDVTHQPWLAQLFKREDNQPYLLWVMHHNVVDQVSWQIILDDLNTAYQQLQAGRQVKLADVTSDYVTWSQWCQAHSLANMAVIPASKIPCLPLYEHQVMTKRLVGDTHVMQQAIDVELYRDMEGGILAQNTQQVLLVSAMAQAIREWASIEQVVIAHETHGRTVEGIDISRTVGWFTHFNSVVINTSECLLNTLHTSHRQILATQQLASVDRAIDIGSLEKSHVCINFLGKHSAHDHNHVIKLDPKLLLAHQIGEQNHRGFMLTLDIEATVKGLNLYWYHAQLGDSAMRIKQLASRFEANLNTLVLMLQEQQSGDFLRVCDPRVDITHKQFSELNHADKTQHILPANGMQQAMVFHSDHHETGHFYHEQLCFTLPKAQPSEQNFYKQCWQQLVEMHPMLRARFMHDASQSPVIVIDTYIDIEWQSVQMSCDTQLEALLKEDKIRGFNLEQGPLHRMYWIEKDEQISMLFVHHHSILDGWSISLLLTQFTDLINKKPLELVDYDLCANKPPFSLVEAFWTKQLTDFTHSKLPLETLSVTEQASGKLGCYLSEFLCLSKSQTDALKAFARKASVSLNTVLQAAWALVLQRQRGSKTVYFGVTHAGRQPERGHLQQSVGLFIETIPLPITYQGDTSLEAWLEHIQSQMGLIQNQAADLAELKVIAGLSGDSRLFDSLVVFENYPHGSSPSHFVFDFAIEKTETPLTVVISEPDGLVFKFNYHCPNERGQQQLEGLIAQLHAVLERMCDSNLSHPIKRIQTVPNTQKVALLDTWQGKYVSLPSDDFLAAFDRMVEEHPEHIAVTAPDKSLTYRELCSYSKQLASSLLVQGVSVGEFVGICCGAHSDLLVAIVGVMRAGAAYIPIEPNYPSQRKQYMLKQAHARIVLSNEMQQDWATEIGVKAYQVSQLVTQVHPCPEVWPNLTHQSPCYAIYTSGSTGKPKGVVVSQEALMNYVSHCQREYYYPVSGKVPVTTSISFDATVTTLLVPLACGSEVVLFNHEAQLMELTKGMQTGRFCLAKVTPAHLDLIYQELGSAFEVNIHTLIVGGEALHRATCKPWLENNVRIINEYGPTEATVGCCVYDVPKNELLEDVPIGHAIQNTQLYVLDDNLCLLPIGAEGELYIGGLSLAQGYLNQSTLTEARFVDDPFNKGAKLYKTGDIAYLDYTGRLHYCGRSDEQVKIRGHRVELSDIEQNILNHPGVAQTAVVLNQGDKQSNSRAQIVAFVVPQLNIIDWASLKTNLQETLAQSLPDFMRPDIWQDVEQLALTANGKVDRKALLSKLKHQPLAFLPPSTQTEKVLALIWQEQLEVQEVGQQCSFFDLGGHSLKASQILARVQKEFKVKVPLSAFLRMPTLSALANAIDKAPKISTSNLKVSSLRKRQ
jgi:amino acid adenylation domain-containing protein